MKVIFVLIGLLVLFATAHQAHADTIIQQVAKIGLLGEWAAHGGCQAPPTPNNYHIIYTPNGNGVTVTRSDGSAASPSPVTVNNPTPDTITLVYSDTQNPNLTEYRTYKKIGDHIRLIESSDSNGTVFVHAGVLTASREPTPVQDHCSELPEAAALAKSDSAAAPSRTGGALPRIAAPQCRSAQHLKEADASCLAEFYLDQFSFKFPLGSFSLVSDLAAQTVQQNQPGTVTNARLQDYQALAGMGLVRVSSQQMASQGNGFAWNNFLAQTQGVQAKIQIVATPAGQALMQAGSIVLVGGPAHVARIVRNEEIKKGLDLYVIIMGTLTRDFTPQFQQYLQVRRIGLAARQKFQMLAKYDAFAAEGSPASVQWKMLTYDTSNEEADFGPASSVNRAVNALQ